MKSLVRKIRVLKKKIIKSNIPYLLCKNYALTKAYNNAFVFPYETVFAINMDFFPTYHPFIFFCMFYKLD